MSNKKFKIDDDQYVADISIITRLLYKEGKITSAESHQLFDSMNDNQLEDVKWAQNKMKSKKNKF